MSRVKSSLPFFFTMHHLIRLLLFLTFIHCCLCNCMEKVKRCDKSFQDEMKLIKYGNAEVDFNSIYYEICGQDGVFNRFVTCVQSLQGQCDKAAQFRQTICHNRVLKMNSYRYTWKFSLINDICYRTSSILDNEFFKHEKCISKILNSPRWKCDEVPYRMVKQTKGNDSCPHWNDFRKCAYDEVLLKCGPNAANVSDYLFHAHGSYFTKYTVCEFGGEPFTNCWYDWFQERTTTAASSNVVSSTMMSSSSSEWVEESKSSPPPKELHTTYMSVQSSEHSTEESTEWNKGSSSSTDASKKENPLDNDDSGNGGSSYNVFEDNSISHRREEKQDEKEDDNNDDDDKDNEKDNDKDNDKEDSDKEADHGDKVLNETSEKRKAVQKEVVQKEAAHTEHLSQSTLASVGKELYQNDSDLKSNSNNNANTPKPSAKPESSSQKPALVARDSKTDPVADASNKQINLASAVPSAELGSNPAQNGSKAVAVASPILATMLSLLVLALFSVNK